jgi:hypothetical protein
VAALLLAFTKVRLQRLAHARIQRRPELFSERRLVKRSGLPEAARQEQSNSPVMKDTEQVGVTNEELAEVHGDPPVHVYRNTNRPMSSFSMPIGNLSGKQRIVFLGAAPNAMCG